MSRLHALALALPLFILSAPAQAKMLCTVVADFDVAKIVSEDGDCRTRVTPASTFKIALAIIGVEDGFLKNAHEPVLSIEAGDPDWVAEWRAPTDPARWLKYSVVWYSQRIARHLGQEKFAAYVQALDYGNADVSGDPGKNNGLERSWISSSLKISPVEQVNFLSRFLTGRLPISADAGEHIFGIIEATKLPEKWTVYGKTGSAFPRKKDGSLDRARGWGWFVGWVTNGRHTYVFARLDQDEQRESEPGGLRARQKFLDAWPEIVKPLPQ